MNREARAVVEHEPSVKTMSRTRQRVGRWPHLSLLVCLCLPLPPAGGVRPAAPALLAELRAAVPARRFAPRRQPAARRLAAAHHGSPHPARAAALIGDELWLATPAGVLRYDGAALVARPESARPLARLDVASGLPAAEVNDLAPLPGGDVLLATDAGLVRVDRRGVRRTLRLPGERVTALAADLVGTWRGLRRGVTLALVPGSAGLPVTALRACGARRYVGTHDRGLLALDAEARLRSVVGVPTGAHVASLGGCDGGEPALLVATTHGLFAIDASGVRRLHDGHTTAAARAADGVLLLGTFDAGLLALSGDDRRRPATPAALAGEPISLLRRLGDAVLVGTTRGLYLRRGAVLRRLPQGGPPPGPVTALAPAGGALWVGTFDRGLARLDVARATWREVPELFDARITALLVDGRGRLWVGTASGLGLLRGERLTRVRDPRGWLTRHIGALRLARDGALLVGAYPGIVILDARREPPGCTYRGATGREANAGLVGPAVYGVADTAEGLWAATEDGLGLLPPRGAARALTDLGDLLPDSWVNDVRAAGGAVWALTLRAGLLRLGIGADDAAAPRVYATTLMTSPGVLLPLDAGRVLFGTNAAGLVLLDEARPETITTYGPEQGVPQAMVTALAYDAAADRLWIGGAAGVTRVDGARRALGAAHPPTDEDSDRGARPAQPRRAP